MIAKQILALNIRQQRIPQNHFVEENNTVEVGGKECSEKSFRPSSIQTACYLDRDEPSEQ